MERTAGWREIFLVAFAALLLEIAYTRVFSFKVSSAFTYLIIGFALLGAGAGAMASLLFERIRRAPADVPFAVATLAGGACVGLGYFAVSAAELSTYEAPAAAGPVLRLALVCLVLFAGFLAIGLAIAVVLTRETGRIPRLYFADLAGAGAGCALAVPLLVWLSPPGCVLAAGALLAAAGLGPARRTARALAAGSLLVAGVLAGATLLADFLPDPVVDPEKTLGRTNRARWGFASAYRRWSPVFRVDVLETALSPGMKWLVHDGMVGSGLWPYDGDPASLARLFEASSRRLAFALAKPAPRVLVVGAAGGFEILASLHFGAERVTAVELNPVTVSLLRDRFAEYTGRLAEHPKVELVNAEGRAFLAGDRARYDLVYFVAPDSFAAMNAAQSSGFVLVESYLYTAEATLEALRHLAPGGVLCAQFGEVDYATVPNRTARYLATAREAFRRLGIRDFARHALVATTPEFPFLLSTVLLRPEPFAGAELDAFLAAARAVPGTVPRHVFGRARDRTMVGSVVTLAPAELERAYRGYAYDVRPVSDDAPFFWHFARFRDVVRDLGRLRELEDHTRGMGELALLVMLAVSAAFAVLFLLLPFLAVRERWIRLPRKTRSTLYFAALGLAFMFYEIALIQKLVLLLGYPTYTLSVTLFTLLLATGFGSLASERPAWRSGRAPARAVALLLALTLYYQFGLDALAALMAGEPLGVRIAAAGLSLAPLGLAVGAFLPLGLAAVARLSPFAREYVAWGWAANGLFSVIGSLLAAALSMSFGFRALLGAGFALYALAAALLAGLREADGAAAARRTGPA
jgi:spermidine synthase